MFSETTAHENKQERRKGSKMKTYFVYVCFSFSCTNLFCDSDCNDNKTEIVLEMLSFKRHQSDFFSCYSNRSLC